MTETGTPLNPFPGLRPFEPDEDYLFFGREREVDELLRRLRSNRFLSVVGTSGSGKSSLVRSGLIPALYSGFMVKAGSSWRVAIMRPGEDPIGRLATVLDTPDILGAADERFESASRVVLDAALRRGTRGLVESVRLAHIPADENLLIVVDQFEELFRFRESREHERSREESAAFVKLLLEATSQQEVPIYVVITMRADFIGDCMEYHGLPEALNASQYLVPRLTRDELRAAISGPIAVAGAEIAPRLVQRLLNDLGNDQDQLPVLQHVLMRTWDYWARVHTAIEPLDIRHYEAVGNLKEALSNHAEEAYSELAAVNLQLVAEQMFKALTDTVSDPRGIRRPCPVATLAAIADTTDADIIRIVEVFRRPGRSFLMPPSDQALDAHTIIDLSHESLMRCWKRLIAWAEEERASAAVYVRLARAAAWFEEGSAGLWTDPQLELGLRWKRENRPTGAWAKRYDPSFDRAMRFLTRSEEQRDREKAERAALRTKQWRRLQLTALGLAALLAYAVWNGIVARRANALAEQNLRDAVRAVDASLALIDRDPGQLGIDHADVIAIRRDLAERARGFYSEFIKRGFADERLRQSVAAAHFSLGQANQVLGARDGAAAEYTEAIEQFSRLTHDYPDTAQYRQAQANSYTYLGETLRPSSEKYSEAGKAYDSALVLQQALVRDYPANPVYLQDLARTYYDRGILHSTGTGSDAFALSEADFREAIRLLEPMAQNGKSAGALQDLSRALNNLGSLLADYGHPLAEVEELYARAARTHEGLVSREPRNREYQLELAKFYNNLADVQREEGMSEPARRSNDRALELIDTLAQPSHSIAIDQADAHNLRGRILQSASWREALVEYTLALRAYETLGRDPESVHLPDFHLRMGDLLINLAVLSRENPQPDSPRQLLGRAVSYYLATCRTIAASDRPDDSQYALDTMSRVLPELGDRDRASVATWENDIAPKLKTVQTQADRR